MATKQSSKAPANRQRVIPAPIIPPAVPAMNALQWACCRVEALAKLVDEQVMTLAQGVEIDPGELVCLTSLLHEQAGELMRALEEHPSV